VTDVLALSLLMCLADTLYVTQLRGRSYYLLGGIAITIELLGITFTFFRGAAIAALVVVVVAIGWRPRRYARLLGVAALVAAVAAVVLVQAGDNSALSRRINQTQNISGRFATYGQGIKVFASAPLVGIGVGRFYEAEPGVGTTLVGGVQAVPYAHNSYLEILAEQGIVGFGAFLLLTAATWRLLRALRRSARSRSDTLFAAALTGAALAYLLMSLELTTITSSTPNIMFASLLGAGAGQLDARIGREGSADDQGQGVTLDPA
jgi:O-antigen ligase